MKSTTFKSNIAGAVCCLLDHFSIRYTTSFIEDFLRGHQDYPSLSSVSALLDEFGIENVPLKISVDQLAAMPLPAIAYLNSGVDAKFVVVQTAAIDGSVSYIDPLIGMVRAPLSEFELKWSGVLLLAESGEHSRSAENDEIIARERRTNRNQWISVTLLLLFAVGTTVLPTFSGLLMLLFFLKVIGSGSSILLIAKDFGFKTKLSDSICTLGGKSDAVGCDKVSNSKAATILGMFKMSELGAAYFVGGLIYLTAVIDSGSGQSALTLLYALTILTFPYTLFSIYYQVKVVKQLCPLCMLVILVLWAELITMAAANIPLFPASYDKLATLVMAFSLPAAFWLVIRDHVVSGLNSQLLNKKLKYFTGSPHALKGMLEERKVLFDGETPKTIIINPGQPNKVTTVLSLFCGACSHAFNEIDRLSSKFDFITFEIILFPGDSGSAEIIRHVLQRKLVSGDVAAFQYLRHWYNHTMNALPSFDATMVNTQAGKQVDEIMSNWSNWLQLNNISVTPSIYINHALKPTVIRLDEFDVLFRDLEKRQWQPVEK